MVFFSVVWNPVLVAIIGKSDDLVKPVMSALLLLFTATPRPESSLVPPRYVEYTSEPRPTPVGLMRERNAVPIWLPVTLLVVWMAVPETSGKSDDVVAPVM